MAVNLAVNFEDILISVWRQVLVEESSSVMLGERTFPVRHTRRSRLREVDFSVADKTFRGLEQNPRTSSRWAKLAGEGKKVMQFLDEGRYLAVVVDGKVQFYGRSPFPGEPTRHGRPDRM